MNVRHFGKFRSPLAVPSLTDIQTKSFTDFLLVDVPFNRRSDAGLEAILRETFPIYSYDKTVSLEYLGYELGRPRYTADECRILGVTYGMPFKVLVRLEKPEPVEGSSHIIDADIVIKALGFDPEDLPTLFGEPDLKVSRWGTVSVSWRTMMTNLDGVFAAGDIVRGASLVVWAVKDGRDAAASITEYLAGKAQSAAA